MECPICFEVKKPVEAENIPVLKCGHHNICTDCLTAWILIEYNNRRMATCPMCRKEMEFEYRSRKHVPKKSFLRMICCVPFTRQDEDSI